MARLTDHPAPYPCDDPKPFEAWLRADLRRRYGELEGLSDELLRALQAIPVPH